MKSRRLSRSMESLAVLEFLGWLFGLFKKESEESKTEKSNALQHAAK